MQSFRKRSRLARTWVQRLDRRRSAEPPWCPEWAGLRSGGRVNEPMLSPSLFMLATEAQVTGPFSCRKSDDPRLTVSRGPLGTGLRRIFSGRTPCAARQVGKSPRTSSIDYLVSKSSCRAQAMTWAPSVIRRAAKTSRLAHAHAFIQSVSACAVSSRCGGESRPPLPTYPVAPRSHRTTTLHGRERVAGC